MSDLVGNPEDRFSQNEAQLGSPDSFLLHPNKLFDHHTPSGLQCQTIIRNSNKIEQIKANYQEPSQLNTTCELKVCPAKKVLTYDNRCMSSLLLPRERGIIQTHATKSDSLS